MCEGSQFAHAALDSFCLMPACEHCRGQAWNLVVRGATTDMELSDVRTNTSILGNPSAICPVTAFKKPQFNAGGKSADEGEAPHFRCKHSGAVPGKMMKIREPHR